MYLPAVEGDRPTHPTPLRPRACHLVLTDVIQASHASVAAALTTVHVTCSAFDSAADAAVVQVKEDR